VRNDPRATLPCLVSVVRTLLQRRPKTAVELAREAGSAAPDGAPCPYTDLPRVQAFWAGREATREWLASQW